MRHADTGHARPSQDLKRVMSTSHVVVSGNSTRNASPPLPSSRRGFTRGSSLLLTDIQATDEVAENQVIHIDSDEVIDYPLIPMIAKAPSGKHTPAALSSEYEHSGADAVHGKDSIHHMHPHLAKYVHDKDILAAAVKVQVSAERGVRPLTDVLDDSHPAKAQLQRAGSQFPSKFVDHDDPELSNTLDFSAQKHDILRKSTERGGGAGAGASAGAGAGAHPVPSVFNIRRRIAVDRKISRVRRRLRRMRSLLNPLDLRMNPFLLVFSVSFPLLLGYQAMALSTIVDYIMLQDTAGIRALTGIIYFQPLESIFIVQPLLAFGTSASVVFARYYSEYVRGRAADEMRRQASKTLNQYALLALLAGFVVSLVLIPAVDPLLSRYAVFVPGGDPDGYLDEALSFAYPILVAGPTAYFFTTGLAPFLRVEGLSIYTMNRQVFGSIVTVLLFAVLSLGLRLGNVGASLSIVLGELSCGVWLFLNFFKCKDRCAARQNQFWARTRLCERRCAQRHLRSQKININFAGLRALDWRIFREIIVEGAPNYVSFIVSAATSLVGILENEKYGGIDCHRRQVSTGMATRFLVLYTMPFAGLLSGVTTVLKNCRDNGLHTRFLHSLAASFCLMLGFSLFYCLLFHFGASRFMDLLDLDDWYHDSIADATRVAFSFICLQTPFYLALIVAQCLSQGRYALLMSAVRLLFGLAWNIVYPEVSRTTLLLVNGIAYTDGVCGVVGGVFLLAKLPGLLRLAHAERREQEQRRLRRRRAEVDQIDDNQYSSSVELSPLDSASGGGDSDSSRGSSGHGHGRDARDAPRRGSRKASRTARAYDTDALAGAVDGVPVSRTRLAEANAEATESSESALPYVAPLSASATREPGQRGTAGRRLSLKQFIAARRSARAASSSKADRRMLLDAADLSSR